MHYYDSIWLRGWWPASHLPFAFACLPASVYVCWRAHFQQKSFSLFVHKCSFLSNNVPNTRDNEISFRPFCSFSVIPNSQQKSFILFFSTNVPNTNKKIKEAWVFFFLFQPYSKQRILFSFRPKMFLLWPIIILTIHEWGQKYWNIKAPPPDWNPLSAPAPNFWKKYSVEFRFCLKISYIKIWIDWTKEQSSNL